MKCYDCEVWASAFINLEFGVEGLDATWSASDTPSPSAFFVGIASYYVLGCVLWLAEAVTSVSAGYQLVAAGSLTRSRFTLEKVSSWKALDVIDVLWCVARRHARWHLWVEKTVQPRQKVSEVNFQEYKVALVSTQPFTLSWSSCETDGVLC